MNQPDNTEKEFFEFDLKMDPGTEESGHGASIGRRCRGLAFSALLLLHDIFTICLAVVLGIFLSGTKTPPFGAVGQGIPLLVFCPLLIAFFHRTKLYDPRMVCVSNVHLKRLLQAFVFCLLSLFLVQHFTGNYHIIANKLITLSLALAAIGVIVLGRFTRNGIVDMVYLLGISLMAAGILKFAYGGENLAFLEDRSNMMAFLCLTALSVFLGRVFLVHVVFHRWFPLRFRQRAAVIGSNHLAQTILSFLTQSLSPVCVPGFLSLRRNKDLSAPPKGNYLGCLADLPSIIHRHEIDQIVLTEKLDDSKSQILVIEYCTSLGLEVLVPSELLPIINIKLNSENLNGISVVRFRSQRNARIFDKIKYSLDTLILLPSVLFFLPVFLLISLAIKLTSPGPVFYRPKTVGKNGRTFEMYKFRSMTVSDSCTAHRDFVAKFIRNDTCGLNTANGVFKLTVHPRITSVGGFLRKFSLDELPQFINVFKGDMSLVGPRPCLPYEYELYEDWHKKRLSIRPGITGLWQVAGRSEVTFEEMVLLDIYYVYNRTTLMDMRILYETVFTVLNGRGAY